MIKKQRTKRSIIWLTSDEEFIDVVKKSKSYTECLKYFGFKNSGNNWKKLKNRVLTLNICTDHFETQTEKAILNNTILLEEILVENSNYTNTCHLKKRLLKNNIIKNICNSCGITEYWNNKKINLVLHHKNGISNDHRIENLEILCPNCHSQTDNFAGKNINKN